jgi:thymidylate synthase
VKIVRSLNEALKATVVDISQNGVDSAPRGMGTTELTSYSFAITNPRARFCTIRPVREGYCAASVAWNVGLRDDVDSICWWNEHGRKISDDGKTFYGANYGQRWHGYLEEAIALLRLDPHSRRVFVPIWNPGDLLDQDREGNPILYSRDGKDVPCTIGFGLRIVKRRLIMQVVMRSQSVIGVMPYDVFLFTVLQELIANELNVRLGRYEHFMMSAHYYDRESDLVDDIKKWVPREADAMEQINCNLSYAKKHWPDAFDKITRGESVRADGDPIVAMMKRGATEVLAA